MKTVFNLFRDTFKEWSEDKASRLSAALAYYTIFSIAPLLVIIVALVGLFLGREAAQGQLVGQIQSQVGAEAATLIQNMMANAYKPGASILATILGLITLLIAASGLFVQLQDSLNTIWEVTPGPGRPFWSVLADRGFAFLMMLLIGLLILASLLVSAALTAANSLAGTVLPINIPVALWQAVNQVVSFVVLTLLFAMIFKVLPDVNIGWKDVWIGAIVTSLLFAIGKYAIGLYLGYSSVRTAYGAAGSLVVLLLWIYYSALILFFGAEFTQVYARFRGTNIQPSRGAILMMEEERAQQGIPHRQSATGTGPVAPTGAGAPAPASTGTGGRSGNEQAWPAARPSGAHVFAARSVSDDSGGKSAPVAATAAGAALFLVFVAARVLRRP